MRETVNKTNVKRMSRMSSTYPWVLRPVRVRIPLINNKKWSSCEGLIN